MDLNPFLAKYLDTGKKVEEKKGKAKEYIEKLVVCFVDMSDSTKMKEELDEPVWMLKLAEFFQIIKKIVNKHNGVVVKYIGDELMIIFKGENALDYCKSFLDDISCNIGEMGYDFKVTADYGFVQYIESKKLDPMGITVDRCARIAKINEKNVILISGQLRNALKNNKSFAPIGKMKFKGINDDVEIYQFKSSRPPIILRERIEIETDKFYELVRQAKLSSKLEERIKELEQQSEEKIKELREQNMEEIKTIVKRHKEKMKEKEKQNEDRIKELEMKSDEKIKEIEKRNKELEIKVDNRKEQKKIFGKQMLRMNVPPPPQDFFKDV
jgi:class 3 adenylate cyclase